MKKIIEIQVVVFLTLLIITLWGYKDPPVQVEAQTFGTQYIWTDSIATTTAVIDSHFTLQWEQVVIKTDSIAIFAQFGAPDTVDTELRDWYLIEAGESFSFGPATKLRRLRWKSTAGTGVIYFAGIKRSPQS